MKARTAQEQIHTNLIVKHYAGSHAYGTALPTSDVDFRGIFVCDAINVRTPFFKIEEVADTNEEDTKIYELSQFMKLALDCNPNVIETLWVDEKSIVFTTPEYQLLREHAPQLLSSKIAFTTSGYALSQLKRIRGHNRWLNNPQPEEQPQMVEFVSMVQHLVQGNVQPTMPRDFNLRNFVDDWRMVPFGKDIYGLYKIKGYTPFNQTTGVLNGNFEDESRSHLGHPEYVVKFNRQEYENEKMNWEQYWIWKKNRNKTRSALEEQYGYDSKHAMHLVRLLRMGVEALTEGVIKVHRPDAAELLEIRNGKWTYDEVVRYAEQTDKMVRENLYIKTSLPKKPNIHLAAELIMKVQDMMWTK